MVALVDQIFQVLVHFSDLVNSLELFKEIFIPIGIGLLLLLWREVESLINLLNCFLIELLHESLRFNAHNTLKRREDYGWLVGIKAVYDFQGHAEKHVGCQRPIVDHFNLWLVGKSLVNELGGGLEEIRFQVLVWNITKIIDVSSLAVI